jgi:hypothetical protein
VTQHPDGCIFFAERKVPVRYFALYQREFTGMPKALEPDSHIFVDYTTATDLEEVFVQFQAEVMTETRLCRVRLSLVRHTSMSVGDLIIDETGHLFAVMPVGFKRAKLDTLESRTELALHLLALGMEKTPGWAELFEQDPALLGAAIVGRLRKRRLGAAHYALAPYKIPAAIEVAP